MTVISDTLADIGAAADRGALYFYAPLLRDALTHIVTPQWVSVGPDATGAFTTPDLQPGPAIVRIDGIAHPIDIPDSGTTVRLGPLIEAGIPQDDAGPRYVINGGGVAILRWLTQAEWAAIAPGDPNTTYYVKPD